MILKTQSQRKEDTFLNPFKLSQAFRFLAVLLAVTFFAPLAIGTAADETQPPAQLFTLSDAADVTVVKAESSKALLIPTFDETINKDIVEADYSVSEPFTVSAKKFPTALTPASVNVIKAGLKFSPKDPAQTITAALKLTGSKGTQHLPLTLKDSNWNFTSKEIDWASLGDLTEAAFEITPAGSVPAAGSISLNLELTQAVKKAAAAVKPATAPAKKPAAPKIKAKASGPARTAFTLMDASEQESLKEGEAKASFTPTIDEVAGKDVIEFDYAVNGSSKAGVLLKGFPEELGAENINALRLGIRTLKADLAQQVTAELTLKGTEASQAIPLNLALGWEAFQASIDWDKIKTLDEVLFSVHSKNGSEVKGSLTFTIDFVKLKSSSSPVVTDASFQGTYNMLDAGAKGVFNIGQSNGSITPSFDEATGKDVWAFNYSVPAASHVGIWTLEYPAELGSSTADALKIGVRVPDPKQLTQVAVKIELKGITGKMQTIKLPLNAGRNFIVEPIQWGSIGKLKEAVFVISPKGLPSQPYTGTLDLSLEFGKVSFWQKYFPFVKVVIVLLLGWLINLILAGVEQNSNYTQSIKKPALGTNHQDWLNGVFAAFLIGLYFSIASLGSQSALTLNFTFAGIALLGAVFAEIVKLNKTGKHLTPAEAFQNILISGLIAASASRIELLQAPSDWGQLLMLHSKMAALTFLTYHIANACSLHTSKKHLSPVTGALIAGTPFIFGIILLVSNAQFLINMSSALTLGLLGNTPAVAQVVGRVLVLFIFNELVINAIRLAKKGSFLTTPKAHLLTLAASLAVGLAPEIADLGSSSGVAGLPFPLPALISILTVMLAYAGLWGEVYLITGMIVDGIHRTAPSLESITKNLNIGMRKGMAYSGILLALLYITHFVLSVSPSQWVMGQFPLVTGLLAGALLFPLLKTIIETFDGSLPFFERTQFSYRDPSLYFRGAITGLGFAAMITQGMFNSGVGQRVLLGAVTGLMASGGISILRDFYFSTRKQGKVQTWRLYLTDSVMGIFVGSALAFYLDALQVPVVIEKFKLYVSLGFSPVEYVTYPLLNKWGRIDLGTYSGGAKLLFTESLAGVINWSIAAWLFAINKVFLQAYFDKETAPIKFFFSKEGFRDLVNHMLYVLRWGLWMSPIIFTFLRMMPEPTWYNQDGAIRTLFALYHKLTLSPEAFKEWSLNVFIAVLAFDFFRILIWMDHMGLRVASLVNLSFIGMEKLDEKVAKFIGPAAAQRYIPEGVKRFTTWAPLLLPFYLPRGEAWDYAWGQSESIQNAQGGGMLAAFQSFSLFQMVTAGGLIVLAGALISKLIRALNVWLASRRLKTYEIENREYKVVIDETGSAHSEVLSLEFFDVTRRSYDIIDPAGRLLFLVDPSVEAENPRRYWPVLGNAPKDVFKASKIEKLQDGIRITNTCNGIKTTIEITLPDKESTAELWNVTVQNLTEQPRQLTLVPYVEWVLNGWIHDRFHTQYARLYPEMEYVSQANTIFSWQKSSKAMGFLACDNAPQGFLTSRVDFIGRARSIWNPRIFETLNFMPAADTAGYPTFDPIGSFSIDLNVAANDSKSLRLMLGYAKNKVKGLDLIQKYLKPKPGPKTAPAKKKTPLIGHGEILPGTPLPYSEYAQNGQKLVVNTPFSPRPIDHAMSNALHSVMVTNRGLHTSCNGNSQQNRLTPDWADTVTKEIPTEAIYLFDVKANQWYSPTYHPLNQTHVKHYSEFGVDGTALFRMTGDEISTELTVFVPPHDPLGVYLLTVKNNTAEAKTLRVAPYFQIVLSFQPERSGTLTVKHHAETDALLFKNPRNIFRSGWAFASMSAPADVVETRRGRFFGTNRGVTHPFIVEQGRPDVSQQTDTRQIAGFVGTLEIPAHGESTVVMILGQTENEKDVNRLVRKYKEVETAQVMLEKTKQWWNNFTQTVKVETNDPEFDGLQHWLKYQALAERIWARRGFYQTSGAYGYRDQLQDTVNLMWVDPALARKQIILHAAHQFVEGDVFHWFFTLPDGRTAFSCRSHASDNPVWLPWAVVEYLAATNDESILDEMASYVISEFPFAPLPKNKQGWGHLYHRSTRTESLYQHCMRSIDLVVKERTGKHGLPLIQTGDWNDGLDEIGSEGKGESVWLGFFLYYILKRLIPVIEKREGQTKKEFYTQKLEALKDSLEKTWRGDRYLRAFHDEGAEIGLKGSGVWEIDALTAAWAVMCGINFERNVTVFNTALSVLEKENAILLGWPALREDTKPYLGRSSKYPEGVRENGMYSHGVQWLVRAARILAVEFEKAGNAVKAAEYRETALRLWLKVSAIPHVKGKEIEIYGGQPNKQCADILTNFDQGRMIWHGYTGAAGWMLRQAYESVIGAQLSNNELIAPADMDKLRGKLKIKSISRSLERSPLNLRSPKHTPVLDGADTESETLPSGLSNSFTNPSKR